MTVTNPDVVSPPYEPPVGAPPDGTATAWFEYADPLHPPPCAGQRLGKGRVRGYRLALAGAPTLRMIRGDGTVPGLLWEADAACLSGPLDPPWVAVQVHVETPSCEVVAVTRALPATAPEAPPDAAALEVVGAWLAAGLEPGVLLDAVTPPLDRGWHGPVHAAVQDRLPSAWVDLTLHTPAPPPGLLSLVLTLPVFPREPDAVGADGQPISAVVQVLPDEMLAIDGVLGACGLYEDGSYALGTPQAPPDPAPPAAAPHVAVVMHVQDATSVHAVSAHWPWTAATRDRLEALARVLGPEAAAAVGQLAAALPQG